jgi:excisionase family DNA binding protein
MTDPNSTPPVPELLTAAEVAAIFGVNDKTPGRWAKNSQIDAIRTPGGHWRFRTAPIAALVPAADLAALLTARGAS